jgi:AcrR family transcriptional regulator
VPVQLEPGQRRHPKQLRSRLMVGTILEAARQLFAENGFETTTTNQIAERAGVGIGSLYQYFPNKDSLILEVQKTHHDEVLTVIKSAMERTRNLPFREAIRTIVGANLDVHLGTPQLHAAFEEWIPTQTKLVDRQDFHKEMARTVSSYLDSRPEIRAGEDVKPAVFVIMHMVKSIMHAAVQDGKAVDNRDQILDHLADGILGCLQPVSTSFRSTQ